MTRLKSDESYALLLLIMEKWMDKLVPPSGCPEVGVASRERMGGVGGKGTAVVCGNG